jgi:hypothetical protein
LVASILGTGAFTISDNGFSGSFLGTISVGLLSGSASGSISKTGVLSVRFLDVLYSFQL